MSFVNKSAQNNTQNRCYSDEDSRRDWSGHDPRPAAYEPVYNEIEAAPRRPSVGHPSHVDDDAGPVARLQEQLLQRTRDLWVESARVRGVQSATLRSIEREAEDRRAILDERCARAKKRALAVKRRAEVMAQRQADWLRRQADRQRRRQERDPTKKAPWLLSSSSSSSSSLSSSSSDSWDWATGPAGFVASSTPKKQQPQGPVRSQPRPAEERSWSPDGRCERKLIKVPYQQPLSSSSSSSIDSWDDVASGTTPVRQQSERERDARQSPRRETQQCPRRETQQCPQRQTQHHPQPETQQCPRRADERTDQVGVCVRKRISVPVRLPSQLSQSSSSSGSAWDVDSGSKVAASAPVKRQQTPQRRHVPYVPPSAVWSSYSDDSDCGDNFE